MGGQAVHPMDMGVDDMFPKLRIREKLRRFREILFYIN
jgi:hypothetical protein